MNQRVTIASVVLLWMILGVSPASSGEKDFFGKWCVDIGFLSPHGYGANVAIAVDIEHLNGFKPFAGFGFNVLTGQGYSGGIEYAVNPRLRVSSFLTIGGGKEWGIKNMGWDEASQSTVPASRPKIFLLGTWLDLLESDDYDLMLGVAIGSANMNTLKETSDRGRFRFSVSPAYSFGLWF